MIDCFPFFNELDVLEIRLRTLAPYVERFILAECVKTHSGKDKPLFYANNKARFKDFNITHIIIPPKVGKPWELEAYGRECLLGALRSTDMVLISDVDEIPDLKGYDGREGVFEHDLYSYYLNCPTGEKWRGTFAMKCPDVNVIYPKLRTKLKRKLPVVGGGWHFTNMGDYKYKLECFAHTELNTQEWKNKYDAKVKSLVAGKSPIEGYEHLCLR
jgi:beta-1,4-mannosyl-glycoprotein beta-1,4-N-acetylglucosaminyltransferase